MLLLDPLSVFAAYRAIARSQSQTESKPSSTSRASGVPLSSESTTQITLRVPRAVAEDMLSTDVGVLQYVNPLGVADASDSEQYQGCRMPNEKPVLRAASSAVGLPTEDKARKRLQLWTFMFEYFPDAWLAVVEVAIKGNEQHNPGEPLHWAREKSTDQMNTAFRHQWDYGRGIKKDTDGQWHLAKAIWRLSAQLQLDIEEERRNNDWPDDK